VRIIGDHTSQIEKTETLRRIHPSRVMAGTSSYMVMVGSKAIGIITEFQSGFEPIYGNVVFPLQESLDSARRVVDREFERDLEKMSEPVNVPAAGIDTGIPDDRLKAWVTAMDSIIVMLQTGDLNTGIQGIVNLRRRMQTEIAVRVGG
jgi:hypothetical protein